MVHGLEKLTQLNNEAAVKHQKCETINIGGFQLANQRAFVTILNRINSMNQIMELPCNDLPFNHGSDRIIKFKRILIDELLEADDFQHVFDHYHTQEKLEDAFVNLADWLADIIVYVMSEAARWGIPIGLILNAVMNSQYSKLVDGKPVPGERPGKFGKGPHYTPPEPAIREIIRDQFDLLEKELISKREDEYKAVLQSITTEQRDNLQNGKWETPVKDNDISNE